MRRLRSDGPPDEEPGGADGAGNTVVAFSHDPSDSEQSSVEEELADGQLATAFFALRLFAADARALSQRHRLVLRRVK